MDAETESQKENNEDNNKDLAEGEIADLSGDDSKAAEAPETIDLGTYYHFCYKCNELYL